MKREKNKHKKIVLLTRSKINSIEKIIYQAMFDAEISHKIRAKYCQRGDIERDTASVLGPVKYLSITRVEVLRD